MGMRTLSSTVAFTEGVWSDVLGALSLPVESAGILIARIGAHGDKRVVLVQQLRWVPEEYYLVREQFRLSIASPGYVPALAVAANDGAAAVFFHTHPGGDPAPSIHDDEVDQELRDLFTLRTHQPYYISVIVGGTPGAPRARGRMYAEGNPDPFLISTVRVVGNRFWIFPTEASLPGSPPVSSSQFDRQIRAFGADGQAVLSRLRVGVVGAGGTGSAVYEQLVRLGVGDVMIMDDDLIAEHNISRIHESTVADRGRPKVAMLAERAIAIGTGSVVQPVQQQLRTADVARQLIDRDIIFGCTDDDFGRAILSRLAFWYLIPVIDTGFVVDVDGTHIRELFGRVTVVFPGTACLICRGRVSSQRIAWENLHPKERRLRVSEGYVPELAEPSPSVVAFTTLVAGLAVSEMLARLIGYGPSDPPSELLLRLADRTLSRNSRPPDPDHFCGDATRWGRGDDQPMLGWIWPT